MTKLFTVLFCTLVIALAGCVNNSLKVDPVATAKARWEVGEIIIEKGNCGKIEYYRKFLGVTESGLALVQDFISVMRSVQIPF